MPVTEMAVKDVPPEVMEKLKATADLLQDLLATTRDTIVVSTVDGHRYQAHHLGSQTVEKVLSAVRIRDGWYEVLAILSGFVAGFFVVLPPAVLLIQGSDNPHPVTGSWVARMVAFGLPFLWGMIYGIGKQVGHKSLLRNPNPDFDVTPDGYVASDGEKYTPERRKAEVEEYCSLIRHYLPKHSDLADRIMQEYHARGLK